MEATVRGKLVRQITLRGAELEALLKARDTEGSGGIPVKAFSECLRSWGSNGGGGSSGHAGGGDRGHAGGGSEALTHADRKVLYRRWAVKGWVRYDDFLVGNGYYDADHLPRYSDVSTAVPAAVAAGTAAAAAPAAVPAATPVSRAESRGTRSSLGTGGAGAADRHERRMVKEDEDERELSARANVVLVHLSEVSRGSSRERGRP